LSLCINTSLLLVSISLNQHCNLYEVLPHQYDTLSPVEEIEEYMNKHDYISYKLH